MPMSQRTPGLGDRRKHGRGDNTSGVVKAKPNLGDQRTKNRFAPPIPSAGAEFGTGAASAYKPPTATAPTAPKAPRRPAPVPRVKGVS